MTNRCRLHAEPNCSDARCAIEYQQNNPGMISASNTGAPVITDAATFVNGDEQQGIFKVDPS